MYDGCCCNCIKDVGWSGETRGFVWYTGMPPLLMSPTAILLYAGTMPGMAVCFSPEQNVQFHIPRSYQVIQDHRRDERFAIHCEGYPKIEDFFFFCNDKVIIMTVVVGAMKSSLSKPRWSSRWHSKCNKDNEWTGRQRRSKIWIILRLM